MDEQKSVISGISCDVQSCVYHCNDCCCSAGNIEVGKAFTDSDATCSTYLPKDEGKETGTSFGE